MEFSHNIARRESRKASLRVRQEATPDNFPKGNWLWRYSTATVKMKGGFRWSGPYLAVARPFGVTVATQRSAGDRPRVEHIDHLNEYVNASDNSLSSSLTNDLPVDTAVNSQNPGR